MRKAKRQKLAAVLPIDNFDLLGKTGVRAQVAGNKAFLRVHRGVWRDAELQGLSVICTQRECFDLCERSRLDIDNDADGRALTVTSAGTQERQGQHEKTRPCGAGGALHVEAQGAGHRPVLTAPRPVHG